MQRLNVKGKRLIMLLINKQKNSVLNRNMQRKRRD
jgi:hypothetical protein